METYTSKVIRILIGPAPLVLAAMAIARDDWIVATDELQRFSALAFLGALLLVSGVVGTVRLRRDRRQEQPPARTLPRKLAWFLLSALLAGLLTN